FDIPTDFPSVCSICGSLFSTEEKIKFFKPFMEAYYYETIEV
ncbi:YydG family peptide radical SAM peptide maturase, partial [Staphylococcus pseudintermedius]|nr:YydG family peptide radical SAM peptide maturase [Staphylococcus pseudintermedius]